MATGFTLENINGGSLTVQYSGTGTEHKVLTLPEVSGPIAYGQTSGFKNYIINGNFDVWQRGTSQTTGGYGSADRWYFGWASGSLSVSKYEDSDSTGCTLTSNNLVGGYMLQQIEDVRKLSGKTVTVSFLWTLASGTPITINTRLTQMFGTGGSAAVDIPPPQPPDLTTSGMKSFTVNIPSTLGKQINTTDSSLRLLIGLAGTFSGTMSKVRLEEGSVATPFEQRPYGLELSLCQRYFRKVGRGFSGVTNGTANILISGTFSEMRIAPTMTLIPGSGVNALVIAGASNATINSVVNVSATSTSAWIYCAGSFTANLQHTCVNDMFLASAEL